MSNEFDKTIVEIIDLIKEAGFNPYSQLYGYVKKGKPEYITRNGNAREKIKSLNWLELKEYVEHMQDGQASDE